ncbi:MAG TPA: toll/interleukin-1 receptor domain-containing protein [Pyrinomonadaceae bacterium]|nr:toll/interleukin-1 receptor domain-containing protein [Pyrinomonadaceae bacterium]
MANPEHLKIIEQGIDVWNDWRTKNPEIIVDLSGADLFKLDLFPRRRAPANLSNVNLSEALLMHANLHGADLRGANLTKANLGEANLDAAQLNQAVLSGSYLVGANFTNAELRGAELTGAMLGSTVFGNATLTDAKGLELCSHFVPSVIDHATLRKSGRLPLSFLRGCGLPDTLIEYIPSLLSGPVQFYSCFISYSSKDQDFAECLYVDLQNKGVRCWFAPEDLKIGDKIRDSIDESIRLRDKLLLILTESSIASDWVEHEVESALEEEKQRGRTILFPIRLDDAVMESSKAWASLIRRTRHIGDFTHWKDHDSYQTAFDRLLRDLKAEEKKP